MSDNEKYMSSVKVGPKGQIVIPKEIRDMFQISPGDTLLILADAQRGIALERYQVFEQIAESIFQGRGRISILTTASRSPGLLPRPSGS